MSRCFMILFKNEKNEAWRSGTARRFSRHPLPFFWQSFPPPNPLSVHVAWAGPRAQLRAWDRSLCSWVTSSRAGEGSKWVQREWFLGFYGVSCKRVSVFPSGLELERVGGWDWSQAPSRAKDGEKASVWALNPAVPHTTPILEWSVTAAVLVC